VYFTPEHHARLKTEARALGKPLAALIMERSLGGTTPVTDVISDDEISDDDLIATALPLIDLMIERLLLLISNGMGGTLVTGTQWVGQQDSADIVFLSTDDD
jgi:hypothetical protein